MAKRDRHSKNGRLNVAFTILSVISVLLFVTPTKRTASSPQTSKLAAPIAVSLPEDVDRPEKKSEPRIDLALEPSNTKVQQTILGPERLVQVIRAPAMREEAPTEPAAQEIVQEQVLVAAPSSEARNSLVRDFWIELGSGVSFSSNTQTVAGFSDIQYSLIKGPSYMANGGFYFSDSFGFDFGYSANPGEVKSSNSLSARNGVYTWQIMAVELLFRPDPKVDQKSNLIWRLGFQQHQLPFMVPESPSVINVIESPMTNLSLGFEYKRLTREKLRFEWQMRYQLPISQSVEGDATISILPQFAFDGSVGSAYQLNESIFIGVYWHGQYQKFDFEYRNTSGSSFSGKQSLFYSGLDIRFGLEF